MCKNADDLATYAFLFSDCLGCRDNGGNIKYCRKSIEFYSDAFKNANRSGEHNSVIVT